MARKWKLALQADDITGVVVDVGHPHQSRLRALSSAIPALHER
jgi:hypothetical protein